MPAQRIDELPLTVPVFHILLALSDDELHGYALIRAIERRTNGEVRLTASTLYGAIARLLEAGLIREQRTESVEDRRRRYRITAAGRSLLRQEAARLHRAATWARGVRLLSGRGGRG
jgi:DNA-binding PadR family transcriptional regulator